MTSLPMPPANDSDAFVLPGEICDLTNGSQSEAALATGRTIPYYPRLIVKSYIGSI
jgi:hypothetical protein